MIYAAVANLYQILVVPGSLAANVHNERRKGCETVRDSLGLYLSRGVAVSKKFLNILGNK